MTWIIKELQLSLLHSALLYINRGLHSTKKQEENPLHIQEKQEGEEASCAHTMNFFSLFSCFISCPAPLSDTCSGFLHDICGIVWSHLIRPYPDHVILTATTFFLCICLPHPNNFVLVWFFFLFLWQWHYQLISHNAHSTA